MLFHPAQNLADEQQDERHGQHIADDAGGKDHPRVKTLGDAVGNAAAQLDNGDGGDQEGQQQPSRL